MVRGSTRVWGWLERLIVLVAVNSINVVKYRFAFIKTVRELSVDVIDDFVAVSEC